MTIDRKFYVACAGGGALGTLVAFVVNPNWWWLGLFAGFAAGYIFKDTLGFLRAIPRAWSVVVGNDAFDSGLGKACFFALVVTALTFFSMAYIQYASPASILAFLGALVVFLICAFCFSAILFMGFCLLGAYLFNEYEKWHNAFQASEYFDCVSISWTNWLKLFFSGLVLGTPFIIGRGLVLAVQIACYYIPRLLWLIVKETVLYTVTHERILAGFCAACGTAVAYTLKPVDASTTQIVFLVLCGGFFGALIGKIAAVYAATRVPARTTT